MSDRERERERERERANVYYLSRALPLQDKQIEAKII